MIINGTVLSVTNTNRAKIQKDKKIFWQVLYSVHYDKKVRFEESYYVVFVWCCMMKMEWCMSIVYL